jgi:hypothetical protein
MILLPEKRIPIKPAAAGAGTVKLLNVLLPEIKGLLPLVVDDKVTL